MKAIAFSTLLLLHLSCFSHEVKKVSAATIKHKEYGVMHGRVTAGKINMELLVFEDSLTHKQFLLEPSTIEYMDISNVGLFKSHVIEVPLYCECRPPEKYAVVRKFLKVIHEGNPFSLLQGFLDDGYFYFYEDARTTNAILWQYEIGVYERWPGMTEYDVMPDFHKQMLGLFSQEGVSVPLYFLKKHKERYDADYLLNVTKVLNQDSGYKAETFAESSRKSLPRWSLALRGWYSRLRYVDYMKVSGVNIEPVIMKEFHDLFREWFWGIGVGYAVAQSSGTRELAGKHVRSNFSEYSIRPQIIGAMKFNDLIKGKPTYGGMRLAYNFARYSQKFYVDGQVGRTPWRKVHKSISGEFFGKLMLSSICNVELAGGLTLYDRDWDMPVFYLAGGINFPFR